jgi:hypothetical protein
LSEQVARSRRAEPTRADPARPAATPSLETEEYPPSSSQTPVSFVPSIAPTAPNPDGATGRSSPAPHANLLGTRGARRATKNADGPVFGHHRRGLEVGARGFEPPAFCSQSRRATRLRYAPKSFAAHYGDWAASQQPAARHGRAFVEIEVRLSCRRPRRGRRGSPRGRRTRRSARCGSSRSDASFGRRWR